MGQINKILILLLLAVISACTTQKSRNDLSLMGKLWHNTTAHYNGYFNADELMEESIYQLEQQHEDNYNKILDMYPYMAADNPQAVASNLDRAIEKVSVVVNLHRQSQWTDDCYLILGQAQFLKQDFEAAEETFRYMINEFSPSTLEKKAKRAERETSSKSKKKKSKKQKSKKGKSKVSKEREKARKAYEKAVKKARKKGSKAPSREEFFGHLDGNKEKETDTKEEDTEEEVTEQPQNIGMISISDSDDLTQEGDPDSYFMKHRPAFQESMFWLAKTLVERDNYEGARRYMAKLERDPGTFNDIRMELAGLQAYYYLKRKDYDQAITHLEKALELEKDKKRKARFAYIVAQLHQREGRGEQAYQSFEKVLKANPDYEMAFSAKLNMAQNAWYSGRGTADEARENLKKMLKESKNEEYQDQIYFALAEIDLKEGKREDAIKNLERSLYYSRKNRSQKAEAYLKLANLYYEIEDYVPAKNYFDSTLQVLSTADDRFDRVQKLSNNLTDIAENINVIELQDSLLRLSEMSDDEKRQIAYEIKKKKEEERRAKLAAQSGAANDRSGKFRNLNVASSTTPGGGVGALQAKSDFFAYDDRAVKRGKRDFQRQWGSRQLSDNWRRSAVQTSGEFEEEFAAEEITETVLTDDEVSQILGKLPSSDSEKEAAHFKIREAMYKLGSLYRERLENYNKAVEVLEELNTRYPGSNYELDSWYFLYLSYNDLNNQSKARSYADKIINKYPSSTYAKIIQNPDYVNELMDEEMKLNRYYNEAYTDFQNQNFQEAYTKSVKAKEQFGAANPLQPRFALLSAMCLGNTKGKEEYIEALKEVVAKYPNTPEQTRAKEIMRLLGVTSTVLPGMDEPAEEGQFALEDDKLHYVIVVFRGDVPLNDTRNAVSDYNREYHKLDKLKISNVYLGTTAENRLPVVVIRKFKDKKEAMKYYTGIQKNREDFVDAGKYPFDIFAVTQNNYREILKAGSVDSYKGFFNLNYLK